MLFAMWCETGGELVKGGDDLRDPVLDAGRGKGKAKVGLSALPEVLQRPPCLLVGPHDLRGVGGEGLREDVWPHRPCRAVKEGDAKFLPELVDVLYQG